MVQGMVRQPSIFLILEAVLLLVWTIWADQMLIALIGLTLWELLAVSRSIF